MSDWGILDRMWKHESLVDDPVVTCDEIADTVEDFNYVTPETTCINSNEKQITGLSLLPY